jgi:hypothetical protein
MFITSIDVNTGELAIDKIAVSINFLEMLKWDKDVF